MHGMHATAAGLGAHTCTRHQPGQQLLPTCSRRLASWPKNTWPGPRQQAAQGAVGPSDGSGFSNQSHLGSVSGEIVSATAMGELPKPRSYKYHHLQQQGLGVGC